MTRIRKQPRRSTKKVSQPILKNFFIQNNDYQNTLPISIMSKLKTATELSLKNLEQFIPEPVSTQMSQNLTRMRHALNQQRQRISALPNHEDIQRLEQIQTQEQIREETKKTANPTEEYPQEMMMLNSEDDNIFFPAFDEVERRRIGISNHQNEDFLELSERDHGLITHEEIDILSMIN